MYCSNCGKLVDSSGTFCPYCGNKFRTDFAVDAIGQHHNQIRSTEYAGFWRRLAAYFIDHLIILFIATLIGSIVGLSLGLAGFSEEDIYFFAYIIGLILQWLYWAVMESSPKQATFGKMALNIIVTDLSGQKITFARASGRFWAKTLSWLILLIGFIMAAFTEKKQGLHDIVSDCLVVVK